MTELVIGVLNSPGFGVILGALISIVTTVLANKHSFRLKNIEKQLQVSYDIRIAQIETLVELQSAVQKLGRANVQCCNSLLSDGLYADNGNRLIDPAIDEERRLLGTDVILLNSRIVSPDIRELVKEAASWNLWSNDPKEIERYMYDEADRINTAMEAIGKEIRVQQDSLSKVGDKW